MTNREDDSKMTKVKPLEWQSPTPETNGCHVARCIFGTYSAVNEDGWYVMLDDHPWGQSFEWSAPDMRMTFDDAAKAAQADYERRILSALSIPSPLERVAQDTAAQVDVVAEIAAERRRQTEAEGFTHQADDCYRSGELGRAAACYISSAGGLRMPFSRPPVIWPWHSSWWKPKTARQDLVRAAALLVAEIERLDRAATEGSADVS